jgi:hypothetical protein
VSEVLDYVLGADRNNPDEARAHLYAEMDDGRYLPMCDYGWNRSDGERFSILRGWGSARGTCRLCEANVKSGKDPVSKARPHKTRWL